MFGRSSLHRSSAAARSARIGAATVTAVVALVVGAFVAVPASATPVKYYTPTITPTCRAASSSGNLALTLTNNMQPGGQGFGSAQITIPTSWTVPPLTATNTSFTFANPSTPRNWSATHLTGSSSNIIQLATGSSVDLVPPQGSVTVTFPATAPATTGPYTWNTRVKQSNNFLGTGNDFSLNKNPAATQPVVTVGVCSASPTANNDSYSTNEDNVLTVAAPGVLSNDTDPENNSLTAVLGTGPSHGTLSLNSNGSFTYTPTANYNGSDSFTYRANDGQSNSATAATVSLTINAVNDAPVANNDSYNANEDTTLAVNAATGVLLNDTDVEASGLTAIKVSNPSHGSVTLNSDGSFSYTPSSNFNGQDSFTYKANDGTADSNNATVTINVAGSNDAPTAVADSYNTNEDTALTVSTPGVLSNDSDPDGDPITAVKDGDPAHGSVTLNSNGSFTYTPTANYNGGDSFTYHARDGVANSSTVTVSITIAAVNDAPAAANDSYNTSEDTTLTVTTPGVLSNDSDIEGSALTAILVSGPSNGTLTLSADGAVSYAPDANFNGADSFTYKANDGAADSNIATVNITVAPVNDPPTAENDSYSAITGSTLSVAASGVLGNDIDPEGDPLTAAVVGDPSHGSVTLNADGSFDYTSNANYNGSDSFTYKANDGSADSNTATVNITVWASSLGCGGSTTVGPLGTQATITNLEGEGCTPIVFTATFDGGKFDIQKPDGEQVLLRIDLDAWNPEPAHNPIPATQVTPPDPPIGPEDGVWCDGDPETFSMPGGHNWCLIQQSAELAGGSGATQKMQVNESWLLDGDATLCRTCR